MGIATTQGVIRDFAGPYFVSVRKEQGPTIDTNNLVLFTFRFFFNCINDVVKNEQGLFFSFKFVVICG